MTGLGDWTADVSSLLQRPLPAAESSNLQHASILLEEVTGGRGLPTPGAVAAAIGTVLEGLDALVKKELAATECSDEVYVAFLEGALFEDRREPRTMGRRNSVQRIAKTEEMDLLDAHRALARSIDRGLMRQRELGDEFVLNEEDLVEREVERMRNRIDAVPSSTAPRDPPETPGELEAEYAKLLDELVEIQKRTRGAGAVPAADLHGLLTPLDATARRFMAEDAQELIAQWDAVPGQTSDIDVTIDVLTGNTMIGPVVAQMRQRMPILGMLTRRIDVTTTKIPDHFTVYGADLDRFWDDEAHDRSVFVMMKFPGSGMDDTHVNLLQTLFRCVEAELARFGLVARRADDKTYRNELWDNLSVYMLGCKFGVALLEDRVKDEFNPNVALEYGFMRALGRDVVLLRDEGFSNTRADVIGTIAKPFTISDDDIVDETSVRDAIATWMIDLNLAARRPRR